MNVFLQDIGHVHQRGIRIGTRSDENTVHKSCRIHTWVPNPYL